MVRFFVLKSWLSLTEHRRLNDVVVVGAYIFYEPYGVTSQLLRALGSLLALRLAAISQVPATYAKSWRVRANRSSMKLNSIVQKQVLAARIKHVPLRILVPPLLLLVAWQQRAG